MKTARLSIAVLALSITAGATPASAHHSFVEFDQTKTVPLSGTVKEFQWTNPHSWVQLNVAGPDGTTKEWSLELASPAMLMRQGWTRKTLAVGDRINVTMHPKTDGSLGGQILGLVLPNGQQMGRGAEGGGRGGRGGSADPN